MRNDLDQAFKRAHGEVAGVIRDLQRDPSSRKAALAREQLQDLKKASRKAESSAGITAPTTRPADLPAVDWRRIQPGDPIRIAAGNQGVLESLPDRRGRVTIRIGGKKLILPSESVGLPIPRSEDAMEANSPPRVTVERAPEREDDDPFAGGTLTCDLRGQRVDAALGQLGEALDDGVSNERAAIRIIHGIGTGALRRAVRQFLQESLHIERFRPGELDEGGEGITFAEFN